MKILRSVLAVGAVVLAATALGCSSDDSPGPGPGGGGHPGDQDLPPEGVVVVSTGNSVPIADAGPDPIVLTGSQATLDGSSSSDADGDLLVYSWVVVSKPLGSNAALADSSSAKPTLVADRDGAYVIDLVVNDGLADSVADTVTVTAAQDCAPVANAGPDQNVVTGSTVVLDGSASHDPNGDPLTYQWALVTTPTGSTAMLVAPTAVNPTFIADRDGTYVIRLIVNDGLRSSAPDTVRVIAASGNVAPIANAGPDRSVATGSLVTMNGSGSSDANGDPLTFSWTFVSRPPGSVAMLAGAMTVAPTFTADRDGTYVLSLVVNDGMLGSAPDVVTITATTGGGGGGGGRCFITENGPMSTGLGLLPDGRIVFVGGNGTFGASASSQLLRLNSNGSGAALLASFAGYSADLAVQPDGNVVIVGSRFFAGGFDLTLRRFNPNNGMPDTSFGTNGTVIFDGGRDERGLGIAVQPDGKILVTGFSSQLAISDVLLVRYNSNGTPDMTFGTGGVVIYDSSFVDHGGQDIAVQPDGKIVVVGSVDDPSQGLQLLRFNSNGTPDPTFGVNGQVTYHGGSFNAGFGVALQSDGRIVVTGQSANAMFQSVVLVARFTTTGMLDSSFGTGGVITPRLGVGNDVAVRTDGRIVVGGFTLQPPAGEVAFVSRFNANGTPDTAFATGGTFLFDGGLGSDIVENVALASDGSIVAVGADDVIFNDEGTLGQLLLMKLFDVCQL